ncbi:CapA family protein [Candidatus Saccharibacteria bacterium]|nr:CapA family protein [Candidatus Saccharibacteria bacterium]
MSTPRKRNRTKLIIYLFSFVIISAGVFFGVQFFTRTGFFKIPGVVYYDDSLSSEEIEIFKNIFSDDVILDKDVRISAKNILQLDSLKNNEHIYNIYVPVTDFYSSESNIATSSAEQVFDTSFQTENGFSLIPFDELDFTRKLLSINDNYYLDDFNSGAVFRVISFDSEKYDEEIEKLISKTFDKDFPKKDNVLSFIQTGVTALSRGMNRKLLEVGGDATFFSEKIGDFLSSFDLTHTSNESSFSDYASGSNICSDKRFIDTLEAIGLDIVELTGNHNQDCGDEAAMETIDTYLSSGIKIIGGGKTADEAKEPLNISEKNNNITMLAFNLSTGGATLDDTPGANQYNEAVAAEQIKTAKTNGDLVIVDIQYYECSAYASEYEDPICDYANSSAGDQIGFFRHLIDLGADVVVGTSAHQPQTFELYGDGVIYYGLGNLFFDQIWWPGTTRSLMLSHYVHNNKLLQTKIIPTVYDKNMQTDLMDAETTKWYIERLSKARP